MGEQSYGKRLNFGCEVPLTSIPESKWIPDTTVIHYQAPWEDFRGIYFPKRESVVSVKPACRFAHDYVYCRWQW